LFSWWQEDVLLKEALDMSASAIDKASEMFSLAMEVVTDYPVEEADVYAMDRDLNQMQVDIRKKVLEHLAVNPNQDVTASLVLISIIIDVERVGDLTKNITELTQIAKGKLANPHYLPIVREITQKIESSTVTTREAFEDGDAEKANDVMSVYTWISNTCDVHLQTIAGDHDLEVRTAVAYCLLFRYFKRISLHLRNIASSVVNPFHKLGYKPE
jgi:phosphate uptake regulator